ncbi:SusE domain-containing protein [Changchengzhania lutea]|uniref:SusE domain-containing protein n=1 Tax=Changchengzhania lutea TaxID=2049305 RepID=UPI00115E3D14|nr:SusE domain-containing protein [Changchengzhania lutea]
MKHIYKLIYLSCFTVLFWSCEDDIELTRLSSDSGISAVINTPQNNDVFVLNIEETSTNPSITISWEEASYQTQVVISYTVEFASTGTNFAEPVIATVTTNPFLTMTISEFNSAVSDLGFVPFSEASLDIRIKSDIGSQNELPIYSEPITVLVTPFTTDLPTIAVPGDHQGVWDPPTAPLLAALEFGNTEYEGYVWLDGGHKFVGPNNNGNFEWGNIDWGDDGTFTGKLLEDGESDIIAAPAGHYFIQADTDALIYSETLYNWGLIGSATPDNWDSDQDMTYDPVSKTWTITLNLTAEEIKFRANDAWDWAYGDNDADGSLESVAGSTNITVPTGGNYTVVLDLSTPREYTYSLTLN